MKGKWRAFLLEKLRQLIKEYKQWQRGRSCRRDVKEPMRYIARKQIAPLSEQDKQEIDRFWAKFGIKITDYCWFQMYYDITGQKDPRFIPQNFSDTIFVPYYNHKEKAGLWADKNLFSRLVPGMRFPTAFGKKTGGFYYDAAGDRFGKMEQDAFCESIYAGLAAAGKDEMIIKQSVATQCGEGVKKFKISCLQDIKNAVAACSGMSEFVIQEVVHQHPFFAQFNRESVNIIRITTWRQGNRVHVLAPCVRFGIPGFYTDVAFVNGQEIVNAAGIGPDGRMSSFAVDNSGTITKLQLAEPTVPQWEAIVKAVTEAHRSLEQFDEVAWDLTLTENGEVLCIEYNLKSPGMMVYQMAHGPMFGDLTEDYLSFLLQGKNRKEYIPRYLQAEGAFKTGS